jgi:hypothetical protein
MKWGTPMKQIMKFTPLWAERYNFKDDAGNPVKMGKLYVVGDYVNDQDKVGTPVMSLGCPFELLEDFRQYDFSVGQEVELEVEIRQGGKQKAGLYVVGISQETTKKTSAESSRKSA